MLHKVASGFFFLMILTGSIFSNAAFAQTGKLSGVITDADTGEPIIGANVLLQGTTQGAATDTDGRYVVIGIRPDRYSIRVTYIGYATKVIENVLITGDRTTTLNITLTKQAIQGQEITVQAVRPLVDPNQTSSRSLVTVDEIKALPVSDLKDVLQTSSNSYKGFVRGSKRYETKTVLDGIDISDDYYATAQGSYGGLTYHNTNRSSQADNTSIFNIDPNAISQASLNTGATAASSPSATGGVVNVTLANMRGRISGSASYRISPSTARPGPDSLKFYDQADIDAYNQEESTLQAANDPKAALYTWKPGEYHAGDQPNQDLNLTLGGSITDKWNFMFAGQMAVKHGYQPNQYSKRLGGLLKTSYNITNRTRVEALGILQDNGLWGGWSNTSYSDFWRFYLQGVAQNKGGSYAASLKLTQDLSDKSFLTVQLYRTFHKNEYGYPDDNGNGFTEIGENGDFINFSTLDQINKYVGTSTEKSKMFYSSISDPFSDTGIFLPDGTRYKLANPVPYYESTSSINNAIKASYTNQLFRNHLIETGITFNSRTYNYNQVYGIDGIGYTLNGDDEPFVPATWERHPWDLGLFASDRMEYGGLVINLGLRVQFVNRDMRQIKDYFHPFVRDSITTSDGRTLARNNFERDKKIPVDVFWNPSIGVSHPIGSKASMYFSFKRSQQLVPYSILYDHYNGNNSSNRFFTYQDPAQEPITSNNYELGVQWEFLEGFAVDLNAYMRSIQNYGRTNMSAEDRELPGQTRLVGTVHTFQTSFGYADVRGIEAVLRRRPITLAKDVTLGLTASYTYSSVEAARKTGQNQTTFTGDTASVGQLPFDNSKDFEYFPQRITGGTSTRSGGYDRTHRVVLRALSSLPYGFNIGLVSTFESGFLYPRVIGVDPRDRDLLTGPSNFKLDLRIDKAFTFSESIGFDLYVDIHNLTNQQNIIAYENNTPNGPVLFQKEHYPGSRLILNDGSATYGEARNIFFGIRAHF